MRSATHSGNGATGQLDAVKEDLSSLGTDLRGLASGLLSQGRHTAKSIRVGAGKQIEAGVRSLEKTVKTKPWVSLAVVFGVGFLAAKFLRFR